MNISAVRLKGTLKAQSFCILVLCLFYLGCSSPESTSPSSATKNGATQGGTNPSSTLGTNGESSTPESVPCEPRGETLECFCPSGDQTGVQLCDNEGKLEPCSSCPIPEQVQNSSGDELCAELKSSFGCSVETYESQELPARILFVVDRSGSMICNTPEGGQSSENCEQHSIRLDENQPSKWEITVEALKGIFSSLDKTSTQAGLMFFSNNNYCGIHSDLILGGVPMKLIDQDQIKNLFNALDKQKPLGETPLVGAIVLAYAYLHQEARGNCPNPPCGADGNRFVVLITDGVDSCPDPDFDSAPCGGNTGVLCTHYLLDEEVSKAYSVNIRTFVIGAPGSEMGRGFLSELAFKGATSRNRGNCIHNDPDGTAGDCHFDMTQGDNFAADLNRALTAISGKAVGCKFSVPSGLDASLNSKVNVQYTIGDEEPICIKQDNSKECESGANGWQFEKRPDGTDDMTQVVLCGEACDIVKNSSPVKVDVLIGCSTLE